jgi:hypothetical protein
MAGEMCLLWLATHAAAAEDEGELEELINIESDDQSVSEWCLEEDDQPAANVDEHIGQLAMAVSLVLRGKWVLGNVSMNPTCSMKQHMIIFRQAVIDFLGSAVQLDFGIFVRMNASALTRKSTSGANGAWEEGARCTIVIFMRPRMSG